MPCIHNNNNRISFCPNIFTISYFLTILIITNNIITDSTTTSVSQLSKCGGNDESLNCEALEKRYFLYNVNYGEGFNLRRDIYVRVAPILRALNDLDKGSKWILVLPPWGRIPHWKTQLHFPWSTFFQMDKLAEYVPVLELDDFMNEFGLDNPLDEIYQLQHFPFSQIQDKGHHHEDWGDKIEFGVKCETQLLPLQMDPRSGSFIGQFWGNPIMGRNVSCMALRGQASTLVKFLQTSNYKAVLFEHAEVILWDNYGGPEWWRARKSLVFSSILIKIAQSFISNTFPGFEPPGHQGHHSSRDGNNNNNYISMHLRRKDFLRAHRPVTSLKSAAEQIYKVAKDLGILHVFLATDGSNKEVQEFSQEFQNFGEPHHEPLILFQFPKENYPNQSEGQIAIIDQILCSWSTHFIGTPDSTFTFRIFEEREILDLNPDSTFNYFCTDEDEAHPRTCSNPTRWRLIKS